MSQCELSARITPGSSKCLELAKSSQTCRECVSTSSISISLKPEVAKVLQERAKEGGMTLKDGIEWLLGELCERYTLSESGKAQKA